MAMPRQFAELLDDDRIGIGKFVLTNAEHRYDRDMPPGSVI